jgi:mannosyltransferase
MTSSPPRPSRPLLLSIPVCRVLHLGAPCALLVVALALRFFRIDAQSLWYDEGVSAGMVGVGPLAIVQRAAADFHPPLYYLLLAGWARLFGDSVVALRGLTACFGALLVVATWQLASRLFGDRVGWLAGLWAALSPLGIAYAQELRMYMPEASCVALAACCAVVWLEGPPASSHGHAVRRRAVGWLAGYVVLAAVALYFQYMAVFGLAAVGLYGVLQAGRARIGRWLAANAAVLLLFAPWLPTLYHQLEVGKKAAEQGAHDVIPAAVQSLLVGDQGVLAARTVALLLLGLLALTGAATTLRQGSRGALPHLLVLGPLAGTAVFGALRSVYEVHFILAALPGVAILGAAGSAAVAGAWPLWRRAGGQALALACVGAVALLMSADADVRYYVSPAHPKDNYQGLVQTIHRESQPGDAVVLYAPGQDQVFSYYYHGADPVVGLPNQRPPQAQAVAAQLAGLAAQHSRLWVVEYAMAEADPAGLVPAWLAQHAFLASHRWFGSVQLLLYGLPRPTQPSTEHTVQARFDNGAVLLGYQLATSSVGAGGTVALTLTWQDQAPIAQRYTVFTHLLDGQNKVVAQHDGEPAGGTRPTTTWKPGERIADQHGIAIPANLPPGAYTLEVGMYLPASGVRAHVVRPGEPSVDHLLLGQVTVQPAP